MTIQVNAQVNLHPEEVAQVFWGMDTLEQVKFFNWLGENADIPHFRNQMYGVEDHGDLTTKGRSIMKALVAHDFHVDLPTDSWEAMDAVFEGRTVHITNVGEDTIHLSSGLNADVHRFDSRNPLAVDYEEDSEVIAGVEKALAQESLYNFGDVVAQFNIDGSIGPVGIVEDVPDCAPPLIRVSWAGYKSPTPYSWYEFYRVVNLSVTSEQEKWQAIVELYLRKTWTPAFLRSTNN